MTEQEILYSIINTARNAEHNNDESAVEPLVRFYIHKHRGDSLRKYYKNGFTIGDEVMQHKTITLTKIRDNEFQVTLDKIIRFENHTGFYVLINGTVISVVGSEQYSLSKKNSFGKAFPQAKTEGNLLTLYGGMLVPALDTAGENYNTIKSIADSVYDQELSNTNNNTTVPVTVTADLHAVFFDPDVCPDYDWETDPFPFPAERLPELEGQVLAKEFNVMVQAKKDEVQNNRADAIRYHDNEQVSNE